MDTIEFRVDSVITKKLTDTEEYDHLMDNVTIFSGLSEGLTRQLFSNSEPLKEILMRSVQHKPDGVYSVSVNCVIIFDLSNTKYNATFRMLSYEVEEVKPLLH